MSNIRGVLANDYQNNWGIVQFPPHTPANKSFEVFSNFVEFVVIEIPGMQTCNRAFCRGCWSLVVSSSMLSLSAKACSMFLCYPDRRCYPGMRPRYFWMRIVPRTRQLRCPPTLLWRVLIDDLAFVTNSCSPASPF